MEVTDYATIASFILSGAVVLLNGIAPFTKTKKDDQAATWLTSAHDGLLKFVLPFLASRVKKAEVK